MVLIKNHPCNYHGKIFYLWLLIQRQLNASCLNMYIYIYRKASYLEIPSVHAQMRHSAIDGANIKNGLESIRESSWLQVLGFSRSVVPFQDVQVILQDPSSSFASFNQKTSSLSKNVKQDFYFQGITFLHGHTVKIGQILAAKMAWLVAVSQSEMMFSSYPKAARINQYPHSQKMFGHTKLVPSYKWASATPAL